MGTGADAIFPSVYVLGGSVTGVLAVLAVSLSISTQAATGLEPGVHVDPGSPAAKQYVLPLNQAREIGRSSAGASTSPSLFGAGIGSPRSNRSEVAAKGVGSNVPVDAVLGAREKSHRRSRESWQYSRGIPVSLDASPLGIAAHEASGEGSPLALLGGGLAVLLLLGAGGFAMRRVRRSSSSL
jgi:hypothetical protein